MQCKQAHEYAHLKCNQSKFMGLLPLLVCFSCPRILIPSHSSMLLPICSSMYNFYFFVSISTSSFHLFIQSLPLPISQSHEPGNKRRKERRGRREKKRRRRGKRGKRRIKILGQEKHTSRGSKLMNV